MENVYAVIRFVVLLSFLLFAHTQKSQAQLADSLFLDTVYIEASRLPVEWSRQPVQISMPDSMLTASQSEASLGTLLQFFSPVHIRQYGGGGLSSVSSRGFGARQTQILWNGFMMNHPMLGQLDYNLLPGQMTDNIRVVTGNNSTGFGSGATAGSILVDSKNIKDQTTISAFQGGWGEFGTSLSSGYNSKNVGIGVSLFGSQATNNYPYFDIIRQRERVRDNNQYNRQHLQVNSRISSGNLRYFSSLWAGSNTQFLPGPVTTTGASSRQDDDILNWYHQLSYTGKSSVWQLEALLGRYDLDYTDPRTRVFSESTSKRRDFRLTYRTEMSANIHFTAGSELLLSEIATNNFADEETRSVLSVFTRSEVIFFNDMSLYPSLRFDHYSDFGNAFTASLGMNIKIPVPGLYLRGQIGNNFNAPTLNDLYWTPGGNPELKPERSFSTELGLNGQWQYDFFNIRLASTAYAIRFRDGIQWRPQQGGVWSPFNVSRINSRGLENELSVSLRFGSFRFRNYASLSYTEATSPVLVGASDEAQDLQLPYVPKWNLKLSTGLQYRFLYANASYQSAGSRFTTTDHQSPIDPLEGYSVIYLQTGVQLKTGRLSTNISYSIHNLLDREYQVIAWYPMPPRHHSINISITINHTSP